MSARQNKEVAKLHNANITRCMVEDDRPVVGLRVLTDDALGKFVEAVKAHDDAQYAGGAEHEHMADGAY